MTSKIDTIPLDAVRINGGTQSRVELNQTAIAEYAEAIRLSIELPPIVTFFDGATFWLADGFHRYNAHRDAGAMEINSEIRSGSLRDAILYSVGANASHGLRRTNEDKRRAVMTLLNDAEWSAWSANEIAQRCSVSHTYVNGIKASLETFQVTTTSDAVAYKNKHGSTATMNTAKIGKAQDDFKPAEQVTANIAPHQDQVQANDSVCDPSDVSTDELQTLRDKIEELAEALKSALADNEMMGRVFDSDDRIKAAMVEASRQKAIADNAERTLASKNGEYVERARAVTMWKNRAEKAEKALKNLERDK